MDFFWVDYIDIRDTTLLRVSGYENPVEFGVLTSFAYTLEEDFGEIVVATTRVETMLGDTAIAVHPNDERLASDVIGQAASSVNFGLSKPQSIIESMDKIDIKDNNDDDQEPFRQLLKRIPGTMNWKVERTNRKLSGRLDEIVVKRMKDSERGSKDFLSPIMKARELEMVAKNVFAQDSERGSKDL
ncbi:hypothetical protein DVH24_029821 [Malus domestica]|uniref:valine--tRNA ligase n=1 Tax=Malus domestica TaxID=3750 RepID=A0A498HWC6_MALDO|nr:hypothetical protein DVH24_029821 [Malus domestica]